eukprot:51556-Eustigmatos_ZCMA.PRE.1
MRSYARQERSVPCAAPYRCSASSRLRTQQAQLTGTNKQRVDADSVSSVMYTRVCACVYTYARV